MKRKTLALALILALLFPIVAGTDLFTIANGNPARDTVKMGPDPLVAWIKSPSNKTYSTNTIQLNLTAYYSGPFTCEYSVDAGPSINVPKTERNIVGGGLVDTSISLTLQDGSHTIVAKAITDSGAEAVACITFNIDTVPPYLSLVLPENRTYETADVPLKFLAAGLPEMHYSLDGQASVPVTGNITLRGVPDGIHYLAFHGTSKSGTTYATETVYFVVNAVYPEITLLSIENKTYYTRDLPLTFYVKEPPSAIYYRLDDGPFVAISGNTTLTGLSYGSHKLVVNTHDPLGSGDIVSEFFSIEPQEIDPFLTVLIVVLIVSVAVIGLGLLVFLMKRKR